MRNRIAGNVPALWRGKTVLAKDIDDMDDILNSRMPDRKGGMVPLDDGETPLIWIQVGQRYRLFSLQYELTGVYCRDCPAAVAFYQTSLLTTALTWIADHENTEHSGGHVRDPRDMDAEHGPIYWRRA